MNHCSKRMMGLIICLIRAYLIGLTINNKGTNTHKSNHAKISLGRCTNVKILQAVITNETNMKIIPHRVNNFLLLYNHHSNVAIAKVMETTA